MELKSLLVGLLFSISAFGAKSGIGLSYSLARAKTLVKKIIFFLTFMLGYGVLFALLDLLLKATDMEEFTRIINQAFKSGMLVHLLVATGLILWGVRLLTVPAGKGTSKGWIGLVIPCPVCISVIMLDIALLDALYADTFIPSVLLVWISFVFTALSTCGIWLFLSRTSSLTAEELLGWAMFSIAAYFLLILAVAPNIQELERIYRLACYQATQETFVTKGYGLWSSFFLLFISFLGGFLRCGKRFREGISCL